MIADFGYYFLICSVISCVFSSLYIKGNGRVFDIFFSLSNIFVISSYFILLYLFVISDLRVISVLMNSSDLMEMKYKIAASWSSHETSLIFWVFLMSICNFGFAQYTNFKYRESLFTLNIILISFVIIIIFTANPFRYIDSVARNGLGMNPALQDFGMMIHPPLLYISYNFLALIFSFEISNFFGTKIENKIITNISRMALSCLTFAIGLGGWWAYRELGWGGYWFFDPVENISLLVWLFAIAYHHTILQKEMEVTKTILALMPFLSAIIGTFFVRSGLLISVHSFAESESSIYLMVICSLLLIFSLFVIFWKIKVTEKSDQAYQSKILFIQTGNYFWIGSSLIIILSLIAPLFYKFFADEIIDIKPKFFENTLIPLMLIASAISGAIYFNKNLKKLVLIITSSLPLLFIYISSQSIILTASYYVGIFIIIASIIRIKEKLNQGGLSTPSISMFGGHIGAALLIISIALNIQFQESKNIIANEGDKVALWGDKNAFIHKINYGNGKNYIKQKLEIHIYENEDEIVILEPELRFYPIEQKLSSEVDIYSFITNDWYAVINNAESSKVDFRIMYHPAISLIWLSIFLISFSIILRNIRF